MTPILLSQDPSRRCLLTYSIRNTNYFLFLFIPAKQIAFQKPSKEEKGRQQDAQNQPNHPHRSHKGSLGLEIELIKRWKKIQKS